jgi:hypothetical protein
MDIERDPQIKFHELGTLNAVTRWLASHDEGLAEWLKNVRRAYQVDRANVDEKHRAAALLLKDAKGREPARIGLLDVGGAALEDVTAWSTWQDPSASSRSSALQEEETQGNGGKAYMYRLFTGQARIFGVQNGKRNCKGFMGPIGSVDRGKPGFMKDPVPLREVPITSIKAELDAVLVPYGMTVTDLPDELWTAIRDRESFTLVEGEEPVGLLYKCRIDHEDLVAKVLRHEQSTLAIQQLRLYAFHNGQRLNQGKPLELPRIDPYPALEGPFVYEIPQELKLAGGEKVTTTEGGKRAIGRLILNTSRANMYSAHKNLKPRWRISYRTQHQMIGSKAVSELTPSTPGAYYVYGTVELAALEPGYVEHGRRRPKDGPLVEALDLYIAERIREIAKKINETRTHELDSKALDAVQAENEKLDQFKNKFLPTDEKGVVGQPPRPPRPPTQYGTEPETIELRPHAGGLCLARGVNLHVNSIIWPHVVDADGKPVQLRMVWQSSDPTVARFVSGDLLEGRNKGSTEIWITAEIGRGRKLESVHIPVKVSVVDHVLLTPRQIEIPLGQRAQVLAEVTDDEGTRSTNVLLSWRHDGDDQLLVRMSPMGHVTGNRIGKTAVTAGVGDPHDGGVWARIPVEVMVVPNPEKPGNTGGFPKLLVTDRDIDPSDGKIKEGDPDSPALWQEPADYVNNIWWLNLQSPEAAFAFSHRDSNAIFWRGFHAQIVMEMVIQVFMQSEFTKTDSEKPDYWANHHNTMDRHRTRIVQQMWEGLEPWVDIGGGLD